MFAAENILNRAYSPDIFKEEALNLIDMIAEELAESQVRKSPKTIDRLPPEEQLSFWQNEFMSKHPENLTSLVEKVLSRSINFHSKGYVGHQVAVTLPVTVLTSALIAYMSNCTTVYELGMAGNAMEKVVITHLAQKFGAGAGTCQQYCVLPICAAAGGPGPAQ